MPHYRHIIGCKARPTLLHSSTNKMYKYCSRLLPLREAKLDLSKSHQKGVVWPRPRFFVCFDKVFKGQPKVTIAPKKGYTPPPKKKTKFYPKKSNQSFSICEVSREICWPLNMSTFAFFYWLSVLWATFALFLSPNPPACQNLAVWQEVQKRAN